MKKIRYTLLEELRDIFPRKRPVKKLESWMEKLNALQGALLPKEDFKRELLWRLEWMSYIVEPSSWTSSIKTLWLWYAAMLSSLFVVLGVSYTFFDIHSTPHIELPLQDEVREETVDTEADDLEAREESQSSQGILRESDVVVPWSFQESRSESILEVIVDSENKTQQADIATREVVNIVPKTQESKNETQDSWVTPPIQPQSLISNEASARVWKLTPSWEEDFLVPEGNIDQWIQEEDETQVQNITPASLSPMGMPEWSIETRIDTWIITSWEDEYLSDQQVWGDFERICLEELWWELIEERTICRIATGETCDLSEIYTCWQKPISPESKRIEWDIYLEDHIDESQ